MVELDLMTFVHEIISAMTIVGFGSLFTYLWRMNTRMQRTEDHIASLCKHFEKSDKDRDKVAEHDLEIKVLKVEMTNIKLSVHDFRESMDKRFDDISDKLDRITSQDYRDSYRDGDESAVSQNFRQK